ncbi:hypothetical protein C440_10038 [Haloferax mucosum ATCC BAA-1512]|uniref:Uncharacterized protein n=1 Tax=Haloferax mucosum ATCC BAA-1512 TaxID=662479 RepID=M0ICM2_9EURY|nr:hypothetical protein [Haloferax mucosum]ELZ94510.1 hypothetical protein C440_10038 [Haloferax mucosum ATCC BAA-1512]
MTLRRDVRHGLRIGRAEFVRSIRGYTKETRRVIGIIFSVLFFGVMTLFLASGAYVAGRSVQSAAEIPFFDPATTVLPAALLVLVVLRTFERIGDIEASEFVLTTVHPRAVVIGLLVAETSRLVLWFGLPIAAFVAAFTSGLGAPTLPLSAAAVLLPLVGWATVWGYALGIGFLRVLQYLPGIRRMLKIVGGALVLVFVAGSQFVGQAIVSEDISIGSLLSRVTFAPLVDYVSLAFVGTPLARPSSWTAAVVALVLLALTPVGLAVATRQATALWFTDVGSRSATAQSKGSESGFSAPKPLALAQSGRIAWGHLVRGVRHPQQFSHLITIIFFIGPVGTSAFQGLDDYLGLVVAGTGIGLATYLAGATFGLNPLGDERPQLPFLLLTATTPRTLVRGRALAGFAIGAPVAVVASLGSIAFGTKPLHGVGFALGGVVMCLAATAFAVGIGTAYPIYEEREFWGTETVVPSTLVLLLYIFIVGGGTTIGYFTTLYLVSEGIPTAVLPGVLIGLYGLVTAGVSYGSYRYAIRRYRTYTFD